MLATFLFIQTHSQGTDSVRFLDASFENNFGTTYKSENTFAASKLLPRLYKLKILELFYIGKIDLCG